jgi:hypothetical protein
MTLPSWLLLIWSGAAATCAAAMTGTVIGAARKGTWSLAPRESTRLHNLAWTFGAGCVLYPFIYGLLLALLHTHSATAGLLLGALHAGIVVAVNSPNRNSARVVSLAAMHIVYGVLIAFLYVAP